MYFYPDKTKTYTRTRNRVWALVFAEKQFVFAFDLPGASPAPESPFPYNNRGTRNTLLQNEQKTGVFDL